MKNAIKTKLDEYYNSRESYVGGPVELKEIDEAAKEINVIFSPSYILFVKNYGGALLKDKTINGLRKTMLMDKDCWSVVQNTNFYKNTQKWPGIEDWYVISDDGRGNPIGCKPDGSVWLSDHDCDFEQVKLADNFEEFLEKILEDKLYE